MIDDWELYYPARDPFPGSTLKFGSDASGFVMTAMPAIDAADITVDDTPVPRGDGIRMGQDFRGPRNITFELEANLDDEPSVLALLDVAGNAWRGDAVRNVPGAMAQIIAHTGRIAYGRPRKWTPDTTRSIDGRASIGAEFLTADDLWYDAGQTETVQLVPVSDGGFLVPFTAPIMTYRNVNQAKGFTIGGSVPTWPVLTIQGPIVNPVVSVTNEFSFGFATSLAYDQKIVMDLRPWIRTILRGSTTMPLTANSSQIQAAALPPGNYELVLNGTATVGNPTASIFWRNAHTHY
jgi:hypothetical protein